MTSSPLPKRMLVVLMALVLSAAACGGDDDSSTTTVTDDTAATTTTAVGDDTATTMTEDTTSTTTAAGGGEPPSSEALTRARTRAEAIEAVIPDEYTTDIVEGDPDGVDAEESSIIFTQCLDDDDFDIDQFDDITAAVATLTADGAAQPTGLPGASASVEVRVLDSSDDGDRAFGALESVFGTEDGRQCLADAVTESMGPMMEEAELELSIDPLEVAGADIGARIGMEFSVEGFEAAVTIDLLMSQDGDIATLGSFFNFGEPFPPDLQSDIMSVR